MVETDALQGPAAQPGAVRPDEAAERTRAEVRRLAQEFEAVLITQMMRDMRRAMIDESSDHSEFDALGGTIDAELGRSLSASGGFGLTAVLLGALERLTGTPAAPAGTNAPASAAPVVAPDPAPKGPGTPAASPLTVDGTDAPVITSEAPLQTGEHVGEGLASAVSSARAPRGRENLTQLVGMEAVKFSSSFGWRQDPLTGLPGFHSGVDIRMAYGLDVRSVAEGQVRFAGAHGGYGTMVAVTHADGRETRYAHLAESLVQAGDIVQAGQVLGRSGSSGRATGPHLHFEVLLDGQRVDPLGASPARPGDQ
jgi:murein DD-endopeptidase MepM/ murein hydrolase activator NlpD